MAVNNKSLYIFSFKLILLALALLGILQYFVIPFAPGLLGREERNVFMQNELKQRNINEEYEIGFFGNSLNYTGLDPSLIKSKLGLNAIHLSSQGQNINVSLIAAKQALKENDDLKYVFLEISEPSLRKGKPESEGHWFMQAKGLQEVSFSLDKVKYTSGYFPRERYPKYYISAMSIFLAKMMSLNKGSEYKNEINQFKHKYSYFSYNGFIGQKIKGVERKYFMEKFYGEPANQNLAASFTEGLMNQFEDFVSYAASKNTQVILTNGLKLYPTAIEMNFIDRLKVTHKNVKYLDFNANRNKYILNENHFYNDNHCNYPASHQVTSRLIDSISKWYKIPFKTKANMDFKLFGLSDFFFSVEETQDKFFRIEYDKLPPIELEGYQFVVGFYSKDTTLLSSAAKKKRRLSENYSYNLSKDYETMGDKKVIVKKMDTKISNKSLDKIKMYFYKAGDTLKLPSFTIRPDDFQNL